MALIKPEQIILPTSVPDEVVKVLTMLLLGHALNDKNVSIAIAAALNAWPGAESNAEDFARWHLYGAFISLPLPAVANDE